ncbi:MAG: NUDIX hydrolase [Pseudomonadota bacterium]
MRAAASLVLVRDSAQGPEILLVQRGNSGDFPGLHVFPGGLVDAGDADPRLLAASRRDADSADRLLNTTPALPAFIAAVRECLEETGVLPGDVPARPGWQQALLARELGFADLAERENLQLATDRIGYFSHWITPVGIPRRYDTRFFVARMPDGQPVTVDGREAVRADWLTARDALAAHAAGELKLIFPTIRNLEALTEFATVDALLAHAAQVRPVPAVLPRLVNRGADGMRLLLPGDAGYDDP